MVGDKQQIQQYFNQCICECKQNLVVYKFKNI